MTEVVITTDEIDRLPGETFADQPGGWFVSNTIAKSVPVIVKNCEYKVDLTSSWTIPGEANLSVMAWFDEAMLERTDADGQNYNGLAEVHWKVAISGVGDCQITNTSVEGGNSHLEGQKDNNGARLVVDLTFEPAVLSANGFCKRNGISIDTNITVQFTPGALRLAVPSDTGGASSQTQDIKVEGQTYTGNTFIVVYPSNALP
jgi:hypothetical protein